MKALAIDKADKFIISLILIFVFFLRDVKVLYEPWYFFDFFLLVYIIFKSFNDEEKRKSLGYYLWLFISISLLIILIFLNIYYYGFGKVFIDNILMVFTPATMLLYVSYIIHRYEYDELFALGKKLLILLNIYFWINVPIIVLQFITGTFLMSRYLSWGMYAFDHMTGFIGPFGTGILNVYWTALLIANLYYYMVEKNRRWVILFWVQIPTMFVLSYFNENKSIIPTLVLMLGLFIYYSNFSRSISLKAVLNFSIIIIIGGFISIAAYFFSPVIKEQVDKLFELASDFFVNGTPTPHNERAYLNYIAFKYFNANGLGMGINNLDFTNQTIHKNLGINSISLVVIQGGIWYYLAIINFYAIFTVTVIKNKFGRDTLNLYLICLVIFSYFSLITQPFRDHYTMVMIAILIFFLSIYEKYKNKTEVSNE